MLIELITVGLLVGQYVYHRLTEEDEEEKNKEDRIVLPTQGEGEVIPLVVGRVRIRKPFIAWSGNGDKIPYTGAPEPMSLYRVDILWILGIPFFDGDCRLGAVWIGGYKAAQFPNALPIAHNTPNQIYEADNVFSEYDPDFMSMSTTSFHDGRSDRDMSTGTALTVSMNAAGIDLNNVPGYRGYAAFAARRILRTRTSMPEVNFELWTYPAFHRFVSTVPLRLGDDANPTDVLAALLADQFGKHGLQAADWIDSASWNRTAEKLNTEGLGFSRAWDNRNDTRALFVEVLRYIDGVIYQNQDTGRVHLDLIRGDYDYNSLPIIDETNCDGLENLAAGGWTDTPNKIRVVYTDRNDGYNNNSVSAQNPANAWGQGGDPIEKVINIPGCCTEASAYVVAQRELAAESRPVAKFRAKCRRTLEHLNQGSVVRVNYAKQNVVNRVFRIGAKSMGAADSNYVTFDMIEDYYTVNRARVIPTPPVNPFPGGGVLDPDVDP